MTKREFLDTVFALAPNEANAIMDAFDEYVESNVVPTGRSGRERRMSKYIIEIPDDVQYVLLNGQTDNKYYTAVRPVAELEILNSDYINENFGELQDEAYKRGYEEGRKVGIKDGMCDAWETAKKIALMDTETSEKVTGYFGLFRIMENLTPMQAIDKIKAYEESNNKIHVGDEVFAMCTRTAYLVTSLDGLVGGISKSGKVHLQPEEELTKTGEHYDSIDEYVKGEDNA